MSISMARLTPVIILLVALGLTTLPSLADVQPILGQQARPAQRAESAGPAVRAFPTRLAQMAAAPSVAIPFLSDLDPAQLRALKLRRSSPQAPFIQDRTRSGAPRSTREPLVPTLQRGFNGLNQADNSLAGFLSRPPDPDIAVGPGHVVTIVNKQIRISSKSGATIATTTLATWFSPVSGGCGASGCDPFDPRIAYDPQEGRWIVVALHLTTTPQVNRILISVSTTSDPTGMWNFYNLDGAFVYPPTRENVWADYPDVGFDGIPSTAPTSGAIYITANMFTFSPFGVFRTARVWILSKAQLYAGAVLSFWTTWDHLNADGSQAFTFRAAKTYGNPGVEFVVNTRNGGFNYITLWAVTSMYPPTPVMFSLQATITIGTYNIPPSAAQPGCANTLDTLDNRLINAVWRNSRIYTAFTEANGAVSNIRYNRINTATNTLETSTSFGDGASWYFIPAVTVDSLDNAAIVLHRSGAAEFGSMYFTGHFAGGPLQPSTLVQAGIQCSTGDRWGDYSGAAVDPVGFRRIWLYGEWADDQPCCTAVWDWGTRVARVQFGVVVTIGLHNPTASGWFLRNTNTTGTADVPPFFYGPGLTSWIEIAGDWDGDGVDTIGLYNSTTGQWFLRNSNTTGTADVTFFYGPAGAGWIPLAGDWDGDGVDTIGLYDPSTGQWFLRNTNTTGTADITFFYGPASLGWMAITGDWNGDGVDTIGLFNPATAQWFLRNSNTTGTADVPPFFYGPAAAGWVPRAGDWDGNNTATIGLYNPALSQWFLRNSNTTGTADITFFYGPAGAGWNPVTGDWNGQ